MSDAQPIPNVGEEFNPWGRFQFSAQIPQELCRYRGLSPGAKVVYSRLVLFGGKNGDARPSMKGLGRETGLSASQVRTYVRELIKKDFVRLEERSGRANRFVFLWHGAFDGETGQTRKIPPRKTVGVTPAENCRGTSDDPYGNPEGYPYGKPQPTPSDNCSRIVFSKEHSGESSSSSEFGNKVDEDDDNVTSQSQNLRDWTEQECADFTRWLRLKMPPLTTKTDPSSRLISQIRTAAPTWNTQEVIDAITAVMDESASRPKSYRWFAVVVQDVYEKCNGVPVAKPQLLDIYQGPSPAQLMPEGCHECHDKGKLPDGSFCACTEGRDRERRYMADEEAKAFSKEYERYSSLMGSRHHEKLSSAFYIATPEWRAACLTALESGQQPEQIKIPKEYIL